MNKERKIKKLVEELDNWDFDTLLEYAKDCRLASLQALSESEIDEIIDEDDKVGYDTSKG